MSAADSRDLGGLRRSKTGAIDHQRRLALSIGEFIKKPVPGQTVLVPISVPAAAGDWRSPPARKKRTIVAMGGLLLILALAVATPAVLRGQLVPMRDLAPGKFLVAARKLPDPNFAQTVVLLCRHDEKGTMGLVINRQTRLSFDKVFEQLREAKDRSDPVFLGGPVQISGVLALLRTKDKPEEAMHVFEDVNLVSSKQVLEKAVAAGTDSSRFRVYLGYSGWSRGQLVRELEMGAWHVLRGDPDFVFDPDPDTVWTRLIRKTELRIAEITREPSFGPKDRLTLGLTGGARQQ